MQIVQMSHRQGCILRVWYQYSDSTENVFNDKGVGVLMVNKKGSSLWVQAYEWVKEGINSGYLKSGEPLSESRLAKETQISRTPVREALRVLAEEGYVNLIPKKGAFVAEVSVEDVKEIFDIRKLLEPFAALSAVLRIPEAEVVVFEDEWLKIQTRIKKGEVVGWRELGSLDQRFHLAICKYSTNRRIGKILEGYHEQIERFQALSAKYLGNVHDTVNQHLELIRALKVRDEAVFSELLFDHISKGEQNVLREYLTS
jgi:DNA-binding GntR family transcriptional regulator